MKEPIQKQKLNNLPGYEMHMGCHVEPHHCSIDWPVRKLIHVHSMGLAEVGAVAVVLVVVVVVAVVEHVVLVVECMYYVGLLELDVVVVLAL